MNRLPPFLTASFLRGPLPPRPRVPACRHLLRPKHLPVSPKHLGQILDNERATRVPFRAILNTTKGQLSVLQAQRASFDLWSDYPGGGTSDECRQGGDYRLIGDCVSILQIGKLGG
jgi:hypothetical protein